MSWYHCVSYFFGGLFLTNAIPHLVSGLMGRPFQSPFAKPHGEGFSSSTVNVVWGWFNVAMAYVLLCRVGAFDLRNGQHLVVTTIGAFAISLFAARRFGRFNGGNDPPSALAPVHVSEPSSSIRG
jgi:hypothetical protein